MFNDHAPYLLQKQREEKENAEMDDLARRSAPLLWAVYLAVVIAAIGMADSHIEHYLEMAAQNEALVQCLNGQPIELDNAILRCEIVHHQLVAGVNHVL